MRKLILLFMALGLSGCASVAALDKAEKEAGPAPEAVRTAIVERAASYIAEPYLVRNVEISAMPFDAAGNRHYVCVRGNASDEAGRDLGRQSLVLFVRDERPIAVSLHDFRCGRPGLQWQPFPELEALKSR